MPIIPDTTWGRRDGLLGTAATKFASTRIGSATVRGLMPYDRRLLLRTMGRRTLLGPIGAPMLLLQTTGAKSGQQRTSPLLFARGEGEDVIVVGSNFGGERHPAWTGNLLAHPDATVISGGVTVPVRATLLGPDEAEAAYAEMVEVTPVYAEYKHRTDRAIRVFRLTPVSAVGE